MKKTFKIWKLCFVWDLVRIGHRDFTEGVLGFGNWDLIWIWYLFVIGI